MSSALSAEAMPAEAINPHAGPSSAATRVADVIGLYLNPPAHAAVFCADEKIAIQALGRRDRMLPLSAGRARATALSTSATAR